MSLQKVCQKRKLENLEVLSAETQKGYRLYPAHPNAKTGSGEKKPHINYWDYTKGKRGNGGVSGAIPIEN